MTTLGEFAFNKDQVRGPDGKWIHVGAIVESAVHGQGKVSKIDKASGKVTVRFDTPGDVAGEVAKTVPASSLKTVTSAKTTKAQKASRTKRLDETGEL